MLNFSGSQIHRLKEAQANLRGVADEFPDSPKNKTIIRIRELEKIINNIINAWRMETAKK